MLCVLAVSADGHGGSLMCSYCLDFQMMSPMDPSMSPGLIQTIAKNISDTFKIGQSYASGYNNDNCKMPGLERVSIGTQNIEVFKGIKFTIFDSFAGIYFQ